MSNGAYQPFSAVSDAPFGRTIKLRQRGLVIDMTGWSGGMQLRDYPGGPERLALRTAAPTANGSSLQIIQATFGCGSTSYTAGILNLLISVADLDALPLNPAGGEPWDPTVFAYDLLLTDTTPFTRRWLYGPFSVLPGVTQ